MTEDSVFYVRAPSSPLRLSASLSIYSLGIRETMPPGRIWRLNQSYPYLFMYFHDDAVAGDGVTMADAAGATIIWEPAADHSYGHAENPWCHSWFVADGACVREAIAANRVPLNRLMRLGGEALFLRYLRALYDELHGHGSPDAFVAESLMQLWMRETSRALRDSDRPPVPQSLSQARQHIETHLDRPLRLADLSRDANLSVSQFSALFTRHFGMPPLRYAAETRLRRAAMLLSDRDLSVGQVASMVGYDDQLYFSKAFRKRWGRCPTDYRACALNSR